MDTRISHLTWTKAKLSSSSSSCVEVAHAGQVVLIRDSKYLRDPNNDPAHQPIIEIPTADWDTFLLHAAAGTETDRESLPTITHHQNGQVTITSTDNATTLVYTPEEWAAFVAGIRDHEFAMS